MKAGGGRMRPSHRPPRRAVAAAAASVALLAAAVATVTAPTDDEIQTPLPERGVVGELVVSRQAEVVVHGVVVADELRFDQPDAPSSATPGVWIVLDVSVGCRLTSCSFSASELRLDGRTFDASTIAPFPSFVAQVAAPGLPSRTSAIFEVPRDALSAGRAEVVLQIVDTTALDSVPVVRIDLPREVVPEAEVRSSALEERPS